MPIDAAVRPAQAPGMNRIRALADLGQSIWFDYISREMVWTGALYRMADEDGLKGVTSNPAIFEQAIGGSTAYAPALRAAVADGGSADRVFEMLAIQDIQLACDVLRPVYDGTDQRDGYVSLEVSPHLAYDTLATVEQAHELWARVGRDNLMIKVPGTDQGLPAVEQLIGSGINVNITLLFAVARYRQVAEAYMAGLERLLEQGGDLSTVASVASFFVSRIDSKVDGWIDARRQSASGEQAAALDGLRGKVAIANAKLAYAVYGELIESPRWKKLEEAGAATQRLLWASTSTKDPSYRDVMYAEELIGPDTVNTIPESTYEAFRDHGEARASLTEGMDEARDILNRLAAADISLDQATSELVIEGVDKFAQAYDTLMGTVEERRTEVLNASMSRVHYTVSTDIEAQVDRRLSELAQARFARRLWDRDGTLFSDDPDVASSAGGFMGWLESPFQMRASVDELLDFQEELEDEGVEDVVVMGMGGSSLAPDVFARTFGPIEGSPELHVLDSTVPAQVETIESIVDETESAVFIVASKSGSTTEPMAFEAYFWEALQDGAAFVAITDPDSKLEQMAVDKEYRAIYSGDPEVGGRYSALTPFGLMPAAAMGVDVVDLLDRAILMADSCARSVPVPQNPGIRLGVTLGELARAGRDKLTLAMSPGIASFGGWLEQLVAESTGKQGRGIVPVEGEVLGPPESYGDDRVFVVFEVEGDPIPGGPDLLAALEKAGHPVLRFTLPDARDLVQEMFRWEVATATAGFVLGINPFDQPNVQESKDYTKRLLSLAEGGAPVVAEGEQKILESEGLTFFSDERGQAALRGAGDAASIMRAHLAQIGEGDYAALNAYVEMNDVHRAALSRIREHVRTTHRVATTVGFGPRFLHSTGQLHKGGANNGVFFQITAQDREDLAVPGLPYGFGLLKAAQQAGDFMALSKRERRILRVDLGSDVEAGLAALCRVLGI